MPRFVEVSKPSSTTHRGQKPPRTPVAARVSPHSSQRCNSLTEKRPKKAKLIVDFFRAGYRLDNFCAKHVPVFSPNPVNECTQRSGRNSQFLRKRFEAKRVGIL